VLVPPQTSGCPTGVSSEEEEKPGLQTEILQKGTAQMTLHIITRPGDAVRSAKWSHWWIYRGIRPVLPDSMRLRAMRKKRRPKTHMFVSPQGWVFRSKNIQTVQRNFPGFKGIDLR
jgi:hypothetical protein